MSLIAPHPKNGVLPKKETVHYDMLKPAPYLPRRELDVLAYDQLVDMSSELLAPVGEIIARPYQDHYEIIFGYDYLKAYQEAVPRGQTLIQLYHYSNNEAVRIALDLNHTHYKLSVIDVANAYQAAMKHFSWRKADLARALHLKPSTISNRLKLTELHSEVKIFVGDGRISMEQAKTLSRLPHPDQLKFAQLAVNNNWNTRQLYKKVNPSWRGKTENQPDQVSVPSKDEQVIQLEQRLSDTIGSPVNLELDKNKSYKGKMTIPFYSNSGLIGLIEHLEKASTDSQRWKGEIHIRIDNLDHLDGVLADLCPQSDEWD